MVIVCFSAVLNVDMHVLVSDIDLTYAFLCKFELLLFDTYWVPGF